MPIYLDNAATTRPDTRVTRLVAELESDFYANDSSTHRMGVAAALKTEEARANIAGLLGARPDEVYFTSGGTEANNLTLLGTFAARKKGRNHLVISAIEHSSVHNTALRLKKTGADLTIVRPRANGLIAPADIKAAIRPGTFLVSVIHASNETGSVQPIEQIGTICRAAKVLFHTDACQSFTKLLMDVKRQRLDLVTINSHKVHGPKGVGALYVRKGVKLVPLMEGGGHEGGLRSGTRNTPGIAGFGLAAALATPVQARAIAALRDIFWNKLSDLPGARLNCAAAPRLCGILSVTLPSIASASALLRAMSDKGVYLSAGSACSAGSNAPSRVLKAFGLSGEEALRTIRISLSRFNTDAEVTAAAREISAYVRKYGAGKA